MNSTLRLWVISLSLCVFALAQDPANVPPTTDPVASRPVEAVTKPTEQVPPTNAEPQPSAPATEPVVTPPAKPVVPTPESHFGFKMGTDNRLAMWADLVAYYKKVDEASDRVLLREVGKSTEGRPFIVLEISSPENLSKRDEIMAMQKRLASGRVNDPAEKQKLIDDSRFVLYMHCNMHSSEIASSVMVPELVYDLATAEDAHTLSILQNAVLVISPSANPDGIDKIVDWYDRYVGTRWEGGSMPWLYQHYIGHDNNRDWYMLSQVETQIVTHLLYKEWFPAVVYDVHQMGSSSVRYFVPPFTDPVNPNLDPLLQNGLNLFGTFMANELSRHGKTGVAQGVTFDNWWDGGARNVPYRHNIIGILTEAASCNIASPIFQRQRELRGQGHGLPEYKQQTNFLDPWPGGWWRLRDIIEYELISADAILTLGTRFRREINSNYHRLGERAIRRGTEETPYAYLVPHDQVDAAAVWRLLQNLHDTGVEIHRAKAPFRAGSVDYPAGTWVILCTQAYRAHLKDLLERQDYPEIKASQNGEIIRPYDNAGWTLPLQFGIRTTVADAPFQADLELLAEIPAKTTAALPAAGVTVIHQTDNDGYRLANRLLAAGAEVHRLPVGLKDIGGAFVLPKNTTPEIWQKATAGLAARISAREALPEGSRPLRRPRVALYQPWSASMDEGWTRFVFETHDFDLHVVHNDEMRYGDLLARYDCLVLPSISDGTIVDGMSVESMPPPYQGGVGDEGRENVRRFVEGGGTLLCFSSSWSFANRTFSLGLTDETDANAKGLAKEDQEARKTFNCPGSILRVGIKPEAATMAGVDDRWPVFYDGGAIFSAKTEGALALYAGEDPLLSGYLEQPSVISGRAAMVARPFAQGMIVIYAFRPQNRGQSLGTFRLIFNEIFASVTRR